MQVLDMSITAILLISTGAITLLAGVAHVRGAHDISAPLVLVALIIGIFSAGSWFDNRLDAGIADRLDGELVAFVDAEERILDRFGRYTESVEDLRSVSPQVADIVDEGVTDVSLRVGDLVDAVTIRLSRGNVEVSRVLPADR